MIRRSIRSGQSARLRKLPKLEALVAATFAATIVALVFGETLNSRHLAVGPAGAGKSYDSYWFSDEPNGGSSQVAPDSDRPLSWSCDLTRTYDYGYCGFGLLFDRQHDRRGIDLDKFQSVTLKLDYEGPGNLLRLSVKNNNPRYRLPDGSALDKVSQASFGVKRGKQIVQLQLGHLDVPEWWKDQTRLPNDDAQPEFDNVVALELLTGADSVVGQHRIAIEEIIFTGRFIPAEMLYGAVAGCWAFLIGLLLLRRRTNRQRLVRQLAESWHTTLNAIPQMVWCYDQYGRHYNERWSEFTGVAVGRHRSDPYRLIHRSDRRAAVAALRHSLTSGSPLQIQLRLRHRSGGHRWVLAQGGPARDDAGEILGWYGTCTDVHDRVAAEAALKESINSARKKSAELKWTSEHDSLTELPNRRAFQEKLDSACGKALATGARFALLLIDLDHFKHVNDSLGHSAGDRLLKALGSRLKRSVRQNDFVARVGGDEFAVIVEDVDLEEVRTIANGLHEQMSAPVRVGHRVLGSGASIGGAHFPADASSSDDLFKAADTALYELKASGRGGTQMFRRSMLEAAEKAASQLRLARLAVKEDSVVPFYQPKFDIKSGALVGFEALLRWKGQDSDLQLPDGLAEAFKDYELATKIGEMMQRKVARDVSSWGARQLPFGRVSINASPAEFLRDDYAERLRAILDAQEVPGEWIEVEVTEHVLLECGSSYVARALRELKRAGISIALDDFGTGHSSLSHLRDFPVDSVKIDRSFVQQMLVNREIGSIVAAVTTLAQNLGVEVVAEGVEEKSQLDLLRSLGCGVAQGHLLGRAIDAAAAEDLLAQRAAA